MHQPEIIEQLSHFLKTEPGVQQTLEVLKESAQVDIHVAQSFFLSVSYKSNKVMIQPEKSSHPDFIFSSTPQAIEILISEKNLTPGQLGVRLLKQLITKDITLSMPGHFLQLQRKGYFKILKVGGVDFLNELRKYDLASLSKIITMLKKIKN